MLSSVQSERFLEKNCRLLGQNGDYSVLGVGGMVFQYPSYGFKAVFRHFRIQILNFFIGYNSLCLSFLFANVSSVFS